MKSCDYGTPEFGKKCKNANKAANTVRVRYNEREQDVLYLCQSCTDVLSREAKANRWQMTVREYKSE